MTLDEHMTSHDCTGSWCLGCPRCDLCGFRVEAHDGKVDCDAAQRLATRLVDAAPAPTPCPHEGCCDFRPFEDRKAYLARTEDFPIVQMFADFLDTLPRRKVDE
jgi:hypothetical protein